MSKRLLSLSVLTILCILFVSQPILASSPSILDVAEIKIDNQIVEVPISKPASSLSRNSIDHAQNATVYIPLTQEDKDYNQQIISQIKQSSKLRLTMTDQILDPKKYVTLTSSIGYTPSVYHSSSGDIDLIKMSWFKIEKNRNPSSTYLIGIGTPSAIAYQIGYAGPPDIYDSVRQSKSYSSVTWGSQNTVPANWVAVARDIGSFVKGVDYTVNLIYYKDSSHTTTETVKCTFNHHF